MGKSEEWKQIKDFPNYYISNKGRVASNGMKQGNKVYGFRILKPLDNGSGYLKVHIRTPKGIKKSKYVHRLVAEAFIDNQSNKPLHPMLPSASCSSVFCSCRQDPPCAKIPHLHPCSLWLCAPPM